MIVVRSVSFGPVQYLHKVKGTLRDICHTVVMLDQTTRSVFTPLAQEIWTAGRKSFLGLGSASMLTSVNINV